MSAVATINRPATSPVAPPATARVLVATAGEPDSLGVLRVAAELARYRRAAVMALGVSTPFPHTVSGLVSLKRPIMTDEENRLKVLAHACAAIDFSPASIASAVAAASLLATGGTLTLAHACAFRGVKARDGDLVDIYRAGAAAKLHAAAVEVRRHTRRHVETVMLEGEPSKAVLNYARRERCDLISLGGHEHGLIDRILLGSVRTNVVRGATCSVLIAPPRA